MRISKITLWVVRFDSFLETRISDGISVISTSASDSEFSTTRDLSFIDFSLPECFRRVFIFSISTKIHFFNLNLPNGAIFLELSPAKIILFSRFCFDCLACLYNLISRINRTNRMSRIIRVVLKIINRQKMFTFQLCSFLKYL